MSAMTMSPLYPAPRAVQPRAVQPRLRITARGRAVVSFLIAVPLVIAALAMSLNAGPATASLDGSTASFEYVTVDAGESLWQLAEGLAPAADPRDVIQQIVQLNQLSSTEVYAGQELAVPPQYSTQ